MTLTSKLYFYWKVFLTSSEGFSKTLASFGTTGRGLIVKLINARRLEITPKTKENHNIEQEGKPDFRDGVTETGCKATVSYEG